MALPNKFVSLALAFAFACTAGAGVLKDFRLKPMGYYPDAPLASDTHGNLYGTTLDGGSNAARQCSSEGCGVVFMLTPNGSGGYSYSVIHTFTGEPDGAIPESGLTLDSAGNLYGVTGDGGSFGYGMVYELSPSLGGGWTETIVYSFNASGIDGGFPLGNLIFDGAGNLYGVTQGGGVAAQGIAYMLTPNGAGVWGETILHSFPATTTDGTLPSAGLTFDAAGNLYGVTRTGGKANAGTVFELSPSSGGAWVETQLYVFRGAGDGCTPEASLTIDAAGNLYGTAPFCGGPNHAGTVFELSPSATGWVPKRLHDFSLSNGDGYYPDGQVIFDTAGNLYGTTYSGGANGAGSVYKLTPNPDGTWTESAVHQFSGPDGAGPVAGVIFGPGGLLYGTTQNGGTDNLGVVFSVNP